MQIFCAFLTHAVSKFACRTSLQRVSFALPLSVLTAPSVLLGVGAMCKVRNDDECAYSGGLPPFVFFQCPAEVGSFTIMGEDFGWVWILLFLSEVPIITLCHIVIALILVNTVTFRCRYGLAFTCGIPRVSA